MWSEVWGLSRNIKKFLIFMLSNLIIATIQLIYIFFRSPIVIIPVMMIHINKFRNVARITPEQGVHLTGTNNL